MAAMQHSALVHSERQAALAHNTLHVLIHFESCSAGANAVPDNFTIPTVGMCSHLAKCCSAQVNVPHVATAPPLITASNTTQQQFSRNSYSSEVYIRHVP